MITIHHPLFFLKKNPGVADVKAFARELSEKAMSQCRDFMEKRSNEVKEMGVTALWGFLGAEILLKEESEERRKKTRDKDRKGKGEKDICYIGQILLDCSIMELELKGLTVINLEALTYAGLQCNIHLCSIPY